MFEKRTFVKVNSTGKYCADAKLQYWKFILVYNYYYLVLACYFFKDSGKSKFISGDNAALAKLCRHHLKNCSPGATKTENVSIRHNMQKYRVERVSKKGGGRQKKNLWIDLSRMQLIPQADCDWSSRTTSKPPAGRRQRGTRYDFPKSIVSRGEIPTFYTRVIWFWAPRFSKLSPRPLVLRT